MSPHHAVEIILTRPATHGELRRAGRVLPLASNVDQTRLLTLQRAKSPGRALRVLRHRLDEVLPIDVLTSHYPDQQGCVLLNFALGQTARTAIRQAAAVRGQRPRDFVRHTVTAAVTQHQQEQAHHLTTRLEELLMQHTPEELLLCAASAISQHRRLSGGESSSTAS
ncbi:hypothetical protein [Streptomyces diastatochromogenes]|uniref:hypothetical protein n=1 Tax=Streptomyces diastatochromogenes TaxID=42236 RepID=UPI000B919B63|nr:hypothetical protein [Streptomyces diastatochromogenes]